MLDRKGMALRRLDMAAKQLQRGDKWGCCVLMGYAMEQLRRLQLGAGAGTPGRA